MENYEQKYKEMKKRVLAIGQGYVKEVDYNSPRSIAEYIDPELRESEDEKIIRTLKEIVNWGCAKNISVENNVELKDCVAWLEKQGEQSDYNPYKATVKSIATMVEKYANNDDLEDFYNNIKVKCKDAMEYDKTWTERQGEQKPTQKIKPFEAEHGKYYYCIKDYFCGGKKQASKGDVVQALRGLPIMGLKDVSKYFLPVNNIQKPSWSEEDEEKCMWLVRLISTAGFRELENDKMPCSRLELLDWLKSLNTQPKQEWSKEDEEMYNEVLTDIIYTKNDLKTKGCIELSKRAMKAFNWFSKRHKSLRPQSKWKPSEEQIGALNYAYCELFKRGENGEGNNCVHPLMTLIDDLKKL